MSKWRNTFFVSYVCSTISCSMEGVGYLRPLSVRGEEGGLREDKSVGVPLEAPNEFVRGR